MRTRNIRPYWLLLPTLLITGLSEAQDTTKIPRIGYLSVSPSTASPGRTDAFRDGLRELGYMEGKNIHIEYRWADGKADRLPSFASELVRAKVDVIVTAGPTVVPAAKKRRLRFRL
jgi:putative ABC transport system substrate-binding protein